MTYTKIEIDLEKCTLQTLFEIWLFSKDNNKMSKIMKKIKNVGEIIE